MNFENLLNIIENNTFADKKDLLIADLILEAEKDWIKPLNNLDEFIAVLEAEIGGETSKINLVKLLDQYQINGFKNSAWNTESVTALLEIFELVEGNSLKTIFQDLSGRLSL